MDHSVYRRIAHASVSRNNVSGEDTVLLANYVAVSACGLIRKSVKDNMVFYIG